MLVVCALGAGHLEKALAWRPAGVRCQFWQGDLVLCRALRACVFILFGEKLSKCLKSEDAIVCAACSQGYKEWQACEHEIFIIQPEGLGAVTALCSVPVRSAA